MIGWLKGSILYIDTSAVLLDVSGVGYRVLLSSVTLGKLQKGQKAEFFVHTHIREDLLELYGFSEIGDLRLFQELISVSGIGPKTALNIFSLGRRAEIVNAVTSADLSFFTGVPRLGKKNVQKIIIELKPRLGEGEFELLPEDVYEKDVLEALKTFGYSAKEALDAYREISKEGQTPEERIRLSLKRLGNR